MHPAPEFLIFEQAQPLAFFRRHCVSVVVRHDAVKLARVVIDIALRGQGSGARGQGRNLILAPEP